MFVRTHLCRRSAKRWLFNKVQPDDIEKSIWGPVVMAQWVKPLLECPNPISGVLV